MNKRIIKITAIFLVAAMIFCAVPFVASASKVETTEFFGRTSLSKLENSDQLLKAYERALRIDLTRSKFLIIT